MSDPTIWDIAMGGNPPEKFVPYADYARLKAEVERLTAIVGADAIDREHGMCCDASAQVERLTVAGDEMAQDLLKEFGRKEMLKYQPYQDWNAAKEGKPQP
jgi:hypothetical protein